MAEQIIEKPLVPQPFRIKIGSRDVTTLIADVLYDYWYETDKRIAQRIASDYVLDCTDGRTDDYDGDDLAEVRKALARYYTKRRKANRAFDQAWISAQA